MQKGFIPILIVILLATLVGGYFLYKNSQTKIPAPTAQTTTYSTPQPSPSPVEANPVSYDHRVTDNQTSSPNNSYIITEQYSADTRWIIIKDQQGNIVTDDLITKNYKEIGYNTKFMCQCGTSFKQWINNTTFSIKIVNGGGEEYEYIVDAKTGKVDESSFKKIK